MDYLRTEFLLQKDGQKLFRIERSREKKSAYKNLHNLLFNSKKETFFSIATLFMYHPLMFSPIIGFMHFTFSTTT